MKTVNRQLQLKPIFLAFLSLFAFVTAQAQTCQGSIEATTPTSRFTDHGDGTVTDNATGLMWATCSVGQSGSDCTNGAAQTLHWKAALETAEGSTAHGYSDWRLPNIKELASIVEQKCVSPAINETVFPNTPGSSYWSFYWSSSPHAEDSYGAWSVSFRVGYDSISYKSDSNYYVRLVRSGQ